MKSSFLKKPLFTKAVLRTDEALVPIDVHEPEQLSPISKGSKTKTIEDDDIEDVDLDGNSENLKTYNDPAPKTSIKNFKPPLKLSVPAKKPAPASIQKTVEKSTERDREEEEEPTPAAAKKKVKTKEKPKATEMEVSSKTGDTQKKAPKGRGNKAKDEDQEVEEGQNEGEEENSVKKGNRKIRVLVNKKTTKPDEVEEEKEIEKPKEVATTTPKMGKFKVPTAVNKSPVDLKENKKEVTKKDDKNKKPVKASGDKKEKAKPSEAISKKKSSTSKPKEDKKQAKDEKKAKKKVNTKKKKASAKEEEEEEAADEEESDSMGESDLSKCNFGLKQNPQLTLFSNG